MSMPKIAPTAALLTLLATPLAFATEAPRLGKPMTADEVAKWNLTIYPDGRGLPEGKGTPTEGEAVYNAKCKSCHGEHGRGATAEELVSEPQPLTDPNASKAIGPYWPYATTVFDFIRRSMPPQAPGSLTPDEIYAVTAYLLAKSEVIPKDQEMNAKSLAAVKMPNRDGFDWIDVKK